MSEALRIGVVGCGAMGQGHLDTWERVPGARVTAVCDGAEERARETAERRGALPFTEVERMAASGQVDALDLCTPSGLHADQATVAVRHGLHVIVEKPLDLNIEKVDRLIAEADARNVTLACIFQRRTFSGAKQVAEHIRRGDLGELLSCSAYVKWFRPQSYYDSAGWRGTWALDGGVLANQAIHALDHLCWMAGPVAEVEYAHARTAGHRMEAEDFALAVLRYENGARGVVEATTCCTPDLSSRIELYGTRGSAAFEDATVVKFGIDGEDLLHTIDQPAERIGGGSVPMAISLEGHLRQMTDFVVAIREGRKPLVEGREARMSVDLLNKIYAKAFPGQKIGL
jgi:predicted dehydrogenase